LWLVGHLRINRGSLFIFVPKPAQNPIADKLFPRDAGLPRDDHGDGRDRTHEGHEQAEGEELTVRQEGGATCFQPEFSIKILVNVNAADTSLAKKTQINF
jgi:hypothetical protein